MDEHVPHATPSPNPHVSRWNVGSTFGCVICLGCPRHGASSDTPAAQSEGRRTSGNTSRDGQGPLGGEEESAGKKRKLTRGLERLGDRSGRVTERGEGRVDGTRARPTGRLRRIAVVLR